MIISPSIASSDVMHVADEVDFADKYYDDIHIDIEDGVVVNGISFGMKMASGICSRAKKTKSLHLEVLRPLDYLEDLVRIKPDIVFVQIDHLDNPLSVVKNFKEAGLNVGVALTDRDMSKNHDEVFKMIDQVLMLTAEHDDPKQQYKEYLKDYGLSIAKKYNLKLWLDGGINYDIYKSLEEQDIYAVVMGRAVFSNKEEALRLFSRK